MFRAFPFLILFAQQMAAQDFAGSKACAVCHSEIAASQGKTNHAQALKPGSDGRWAFGAGAQAVTYVSQADEDTYLEHALSWFRKTNGLGTTPGHKPKEGTLYKTFAPDSAILRCFQCHSTGRLSLTEGRAVQPAETGVRCENCHGPGAAHVARPSADNISNPSRLSAVEINDLCGRCHRMPPKPGVETNFGNPWNVRHQPVYFSQSSCFLRSEGRVSCLSCHSTHEDSRARAEAKCAECHARPKHSVSRTGQACTGCHMPVVRPSPALAFTNHWIGTYRLTGGGANALRPVGQKPRL